jgi:hypothetical protein
MTTTCRCGKPTRDEAYFCEDCGRSLSVALGDVPWLVEEMETSATRAKGVDYRTKGGTRSSDKPLPFNQALSDAGAHLRATLVSWVRFCADERVRNSSTSQAIPEDNLPAISRYLLWRVDGLALLDIGPEAVDEITDAVAKCHRLIDRRAEKMYAGKCSSETDDGPCPEELYVNVGAKVVKCRACGTVWNVAERREWLLVEAEEVLAPAVEISRAVSWLGTEPLTAERVRQWASRGRLAVRGHDREARPLYRVGDAIDILSGSAKKGSAA